jgi:hypothetical protein
MSDLRFEIRNLKLVEEKQSYGSSAKFTGTVIATSAKGGPKNAFYLLLSVRRLEGGDPELTRDPNDPTMVLVTNGIGDLEIYGGLRGLGDTWPREKIAVKVVGLIPIVPLSDTTETASP